MGIVASLFVMALYKATETLWEKAVEDAAWTPAYQALKTRFLRLAGKDRESERRAAFLQAAKVAHANTLRYAADPQQAERILDVLNGERDRRGAEALAEEAGKLMLFSAAPDVPRLTRLCERTLHFETLFADEPPPPAETVAEVLADFLTNLREALLDQEPYSDLIQREMLRALREVVAELRPVAYDDEATYRAQMAAMYRELEFVGIPELKERRPITVDEIFVRLRVERKDEGIPQSVYETPIEDLDLSAQAYNVLKRAGITQVGEILERLHRGEEELLVIRDFGRASLTHLTERLNALGPIRGKVTVTRDVNEALREAKRLVVLGDPGAGKTTLLKYLTVICAEGRAETELALRADGAGSPLPVFIPLREFAAECAGRDQDYSLLDYLYTQVREHLMLNLPRGFFEEALEAGRCLVCLDGLDEVWAVGQRKAVRDAVKALAARFPRSRYVVTSRVVGYDDAPLDRRDFVHHTILPLEDEDIREFVRRWYAARERDPVQRQRRTEDLIATIDGEPRIQSLARNPLLLTIIVLVHRIEAELPHERVKLYDKCVTALVDTWEEVKGLTIEEKQRPFYRYRRRLLERLAYELHTRAEEPGQVRMVKEGDLELLLTRFLMENRRLGFADDPDGAREEVRAFIHLARGRTGLLIERGEGVFGFPHLTFQEYLAACDIENRCIHRGVDAIWGEIKDRLHDPHWREVILLLLGSLNKYDEPPTLLVERILGADEDDKFEPVLHRHLYLAARALADRVDVADELHRAIVHQLLTIAREKFRVAEEFSVASYTPMGVQAQGEAKDAFAALGELKGDPYAAKGILALASDPDIGAQGCSAAVATLGQLGRVGEEMLDNLFALASNPQANDWVRQAAAAALGRLGRAKEATEVLLALARDSQVDRLARYGAVWTLVQLDCVEETVKALLALTCDPQVDEWLRGQIAAALGKLGRAKEAADILLALARDEQVDDWVRSEAVEALGKLGRVEEAAGILLTLACDLQVRANARLIAARALGHLGYTKEAVEALLALVSDQQVNHWVRRAAAEGLRQLGSAEEATRALLALARDSQLEAEGDSGAIEHLEQVGHANEVVDGLLALARHTQLEAGVRRAAVETLGQLGHTKEQVLDGLLILAQDSQVDENVRWAAYESLKRLVGSPVD